MIYETINQDIKKAMVAKDNDTRDALRFLKSKVQQVEVDSRKDIDDDGVVDVIKKLIKQNRDSLSFNPSDKDKIIKEITIWGGYLPAQMSNDEIEVEIKKIISDNGFGSVKDMGKVIGIVKKEFGSKVDMSSASKTVKSLLA